MKKLTRRLTLALARGLALLLTLCGLLALGVPALALGRTREASITFREIRLVVAGREITPVDSDGVPVEPFILDGSTYLPLRAAAGALGLSVDWDDASSTVSLTSGGEKTSGRGEPVLTRATRSVTVTYRGIRLVVDGKTVTPTDSDGAPVEPFILDGSTYLPLRAVAGALGVAVDWDGSTSTAYLGGVPESWWFVKSETNLDAAGAQTDSTVYNYSAAGYCTSMTYTCTDTPSLSYTASLTYDAAGNLTAVDKSNGDYSRFVYDAAGRETKYETCVSGVLTRFAYTYDGNDRVLTASAEDATGSAVSSYTYNERGDTARCVTVITLSGGEPYTLTERFSYTYGPGGVKLRTDDTTAYSNSDRVVTRSCEDTYGADGTLVSETVLESDSVSKKSGGTCTVYIRDKAGRVTIAYQYSVSGGEKSYGDTVRYTYDAAGNTLSIASDSRTVAYTYFLYQLTA